MSRAVKAAVMAAMVVYALAIVFSLGVVTERARFDARRQEVLRRYEEAASAARQRLMELEGRR